MNRFISQKFRFYSFVSIALLLYVHGYNLKETYLHPFSLVDEPLSFTTFFEYFMANGVLRIRIPLLFLISGYIYSMQDNRPYFERIKTRFKTLIIPFLIWSALGLAMTFLWQQFPVTAAAVRNSHIDQLGDNRPYTEIGWHGMLTRWLLVPISFQLWFIRTLFIYNLFYPCIRWLLVKIPAVWFGITFLMWMTIFGFYFFEGTGLFFFSLGIWLSKKNYPIDIKPGWYSNVVCWLLFVGLCMIKTFMAFELEPDGNYNAWLQAALHVASISSGVLAIWYSGDAVVRWCMGKKWFVWLTAFSFIIYGLHVPLLFYVTHIAFIYGHHIPNYRLLTYIIAPVLVILFCIATGAIFRSVLPKAYRIATGGRGF